MKQSQKNIIANAIIENARNSLIGYCNYAHPGFGQPKHLVYIAKELEKVERYEYDGLVISTPPGHAKSTLVSQRFIEWLIGRNPDRRIIHATYNFAFTKTWSRKIRDYMEGSFYKKVFPGVIVDPYSRKLEEWNIKDRNGFYFATGVGGGATGRRSDCLLIDDPIKKPEEADSKTYREKMYEWYCSVARTRLEPPHGCVVLIMTRWNTDDLAGRIIEDIKHVDSKREWKVINLPALIETEDQEKNDVLSRKIGETLWPEKFDKDYLLSIKTSTKTASRTWNSLYQGNPRNPEDYIIQSEWVDVKQDYEELPNIPLLKTGGIDTATSKKDSACMTSLVTVYSDYQKKSVYIHDVFLDKITLSGFAKFLSTAHKLNGYHRIELEGNNAGESFRQSIKEENKLIPLECPWTQTDKRVRLYEIQPWFENRMVFFNKYNEKVQKLKEHLINFDSNDVKDDIDALGFAIKALDHIQVFKVSSESEDVFEEEDIDENIDIGSMQL